MHAIVAANRLEDPNAICPGQALIIPRPGEVPSPPPGGIVHVVRRGETVFDLANRFGTTAQEIVRANQIAHPEFVLPGQQLVIPEQTEVGEDWPMLGRTSGRAGTGPVALEGIPLPGWGRAPRKGRGVLPSAPVIRYDRVFVGLSDGWFYALDRKSGRVKWHLEALGSEADERVAGHALAAPAAFDGLVYLCGLDGTVHAVDAYTGRPIWKVALGGLITSAPAFAGGLIYFGTWDEHLYALEAKTGAVAWKRHSGAPVVLPVAVGDGLVFAVTTGGLLWAVDAETGEVLWCVTASPEGAPVFAEVLVLAGGQAHDVKNGDLLWRVEAPEAAPVAWGDQVIYAGGGVDLFTGRLRWAFRPDQAAEEDGGVTVIPPPKAPVYHQVATGELFLGVGADLRLYARTVLDGSVVWSLTLEGPSSQPPAVAPGQVVVTLEDGSLRSYRFRRESAGN